MPPPPPLPPFNLSDSGNGMLRTIHNLHNFVMLEKPVRCMVLLANSIIFHKRFTRKIIMFGFKVLVFFFDNFFEK